MTDRLIRLKEVLTLVPLSRSTIYERMSGGTFPRARNLGGGVVAWRESDIREWIEQCPETEQQSPEK
ncbi:AlpA family transcriptional regulator [Sphingomonas sp. MG17]|uniref:AlpA family transcriptional regulator n=1 Tax=Sphingomonas tagetis TaxID=2949092 RepID=A0A9X2KQR6_9SPHN|nr:AlpA family transcriptional regulator [Sphingomonas tagetis]MCP3732058.1 AlpA family transcriptional regulator [Sphingomonas tagetis]